MPTQNLSLTTERPQPGVALIELEGEIDLHSCPELRNALHSEIDAEVGQIVLDMEKVPYLDSAALGVLVDAVRRVRDTGGALHLVKVAPFVRRAFEVTRLAKIFQMHETREAALAAAALGSTEPVAA